MKKLIAGATLFISGVIGLAAVIISCAATVAAYSGVKPKLIVLIFEGFDNFNLAVPFVISIFLLVFGIIFAVSGFRDEK